MPNTDSHGRLSRIAISIGGLAAICLGVALWQNYFFFENWIRELFLAPMAILGGIFIIARAIYPKWFKDKKQGTVPSWLRYFGWIVISLQVILCMSLPISTDSWIYILGGKSFFCSPVLLVVFSFFILINEERGQTKVLEWLQLISFALGTLILVLLWIMTGT